MPPCGTFGGDHGLEIRVEERGPESFQFAIQVRLVFDCGSAVGRSFEAARLQRLAGGRFELIEGELRHNLLGRHFIVIAPIGPEQLGEIENLHPPVGRQIHERLQQALLAQTEARVLIVVDGVDGDGGLAQIKGQRLLARRESFEAFGLQLHEPGGPDAVDQGLAAGCRGDTGKYENERDAQVLYLFLLW